MSSQDNAQIVRKFFEVSNQGLPTLEQAQQVFTPETVFNIVGMDQPMRGTQAILEGFKDWLGVFPDLKYNIKNIISAGDWVVVEYTNVGTQKGELEWSGGRKFPASNKKIDVPACDLFKLQNGKIVIWNCYWLSSVMMEQLGMDSQRAAA